MFKAGERMKSQAISDHSMSRAALIIGRSVAFFIAAISNLILPLGPKPNHPIFQSLSKHRNVLATRLNLVGSCPAGPQADQYISRSLLFIDNCTIAEADIDGRTRTHRDTDSIGDIINRTNGFSPFQMRRLPLFLERPVSC